METRYVAEWVVKQHFDEIGEWRSDMDERGERVYKSLAAAQKGGVIACKRAGVMEWVRVFEQERIDRSDDYGPYTRWETVRSWVGDYDGFEDAT